MNTSAHGTFTAALFDPQAAPPAGLEDGRDVPTGTRFDVYRNNVAVGLVEALIASFPSLYGHMGDTFFRAVAGVFWRAHPPTNPVLGEWGADLPAFLEGFGPVSRWPWMADVARLENALRVAASAADTDPHQPPFALDTSDPQALGATRIACAPALAIVRSRWPVLALWETGLGKRSTGEPLPRTGQDVAIARPGFDPIPLALPPGGAAFLEAVRTGQTLLEAVDAGTQAWEGFDPQPVIATLLFHQVFTHTL